MHVNWNLSDKKKKNSSFLQDAEAFDDDYWCESS